MNKKKLLILSLGLIPIFSSCTKESVGIANLLTGSLENIQVDVQNLIDFPSTYTFDCDKTFFYTRLEDGYSLNCSSEYIELKYDELSKAWKVTCNTEEIFSDVTLYKLNKLHLIDGECKLNRVSGKSYVVSFLHENGRNMISPQVVPDGTSYTYEGSKPFKANSKLKTYLFTGFTGDDGSFISFDYNTNKYDPIVIDHDVVYTATFDSSIPTYCAYYWDEEGHSVSELSSEQITNVKKGLFPQGHLVYADSVLAGTHPEYSGLSIPKRKADVDYVYFFDRWDHVVESIEQNEDFYPLFETTCNQSMVEIVVGDNYEKNVSVNIDFWDGTKGSVGFGDRKNPKYVEVMDGYIVNWNCRVGTFEVSYLSSTQPVIQYKEDLVFNVKCNSLTELKNNSSLKVSWEALVDKYVSSTWISSKTLYLFDDPVHVSSNMFERACELAWEHKVENKRMVLESADIMSSKYVVKGEFGSDNIAVKTKAIKSISVSKILDNGSYFYQDGDWKVVDVNKDGPEIEIHTHTTSGCGGFSKCSRCGDMSRCGKCRGCTNGCYTCSCTDGTTTSTQSYFYNYSWTYSDFSIGGSTRMSTHDTSFLTNYNYFRNNTSYSSSCYVESVDFSGHHEITKNFNNKLNFDYGCKKIVLYI